MEQGRAHSRCRNFHSSWPWFNVRASRSRSWCSSSTRFIPKGLWDCNFFFEAAEMRSSWQHVPGILAKLTMGMACLLVALLCPVPPCLVVFMRHRNPIGRFRFPPARGNAVNPSHTYPASVVQVPMLVLLHLVGEQLESDHLHVVCWGTYANLLQGKTQHASMRIKPACSYSSYSSRAKLHVGHFAVEP